MIALVAGRGRDGGSGGSVEEVLDGGLVGGVVGLGGGALGGEMELAVVTNFDGRELGGRGFGGFGFRPGGEGGDFDGCDVAAARSWFGDGALSHACATVFAGIALNPVALGSPAQAQVLMRGRAGVGDAVGLGVAIFAVASSPARGGDLLFRDAGARFRGVARLEMIGLVRPQRRFDVGVGGDANGLVCVGLLMRGGSVRGFRGTCEGSRGRKRDAKEEESDFGGFLAHVDEVGAEKTRAKLILDSAEQT